MDTGCTGLEQWSTVYAPVGTGLEQWSKYMYRFYRWKAMELSICTGFTGEAQNSDRKMQCSKERLHIVLNLLQ